jgi:hypothetical protein
MRTLRFLFTSIFLLILNQNIFSQINPKDLKFVVNSQKNQIEVFQLSTNIVQDLKVNQIRLDVFDKRGDYAGTVNLNDWKINMDEFSTDEVIKISYALLIDNKTGNKIELKDIPVTIKRYFFLLKNYSYICITE